MKNIFYFWETVKWYKIKVLNEREARAWAWILFLFAMISFWNAFLTWDLYFTKVFITIFVVDFFIRVLLNPKYAPSLILWRFFVSNQNVEYVWAAQKRFAWGIWLVLWLFMFFAIILSDWAVPCLWPLCILCLILLFFETSFGICLWCKIYNLIYKDPAQLCPGWVCEIRKKEDIQKIDLAQIIIILILILSIFSIVYFDLLSKTSNSSCFWKTQNISTWDNENQANCFMSDYSKTFWK